MAQFIAKGVEGWMVRMQGEMEDHGGLRCPTGKHNPCASLETIRKRHMSQEDYVEGREKWGQQRRLKAHECPSMLV